MALAYAYDDENPFDYFLFIANDNDFLSTAGIMEDVDGTLKGYDAGLDNDTVFLAYRIRLEEVPEPSTYVLMLAGLGLLGWAARRRA